MSHGNYGGHGVDNLQKGSTQFEIIAQPNDRQIKSDTSSQLKIKLIVRSFINNMEIENKIQRLIPLDQSLKQAIDTIISSIGHHQTISRSTIFSVQIEERDIQYKNDQGVDDEKILARQVKTFFQNHYDPNEERVIIFFTNKGTEQ